MISYNLFVRFLIGSLLSFAYAWLWALLIIVESSLAWLSEVAKKVLLRKCFWKSSFGTSVNRCFRFVLCVAWVDYFSLDSALHQRFLIFTDERVTSWFVSSWWLEERYFRQWIGVGFSEKFLKAIIHPLWLPVASFVTVDILLWFSWLKKIWCVCKSCRSSIKLEHDYCLHSRNENSPASRLDLGASNARLVNSLAKVSDKTEGAVMPMLL